MKINFNLHEYLEQKKMIAVVWGIDDVQCVRSDLTDDQAWEVLQLLERELSPEFNQSWDFVRNAAEQLFGPETDTNE